MATAAIGGLLGLGSLLGGSSAKTDREHTLWSYGRMMNLYWDALNRGNASANAGNETLGRSQSYYEPLISGDRSAVLQAVAPTVAAVNAQTDAQKRAIATSGTARGGGVNAVTQQLEGGKQAAIDQAITGARSGAAAGETQIGGTQISEALNLLGLAENDVTNLGALASKNRPVSYDIHNDTAQQAGQGIASILTSIGL